MVIAELRGGLGNQMFQYSVALAVALQRDEALFIDDSILRSDTKRRYRLSSFRTTYGYRRRWVQWCCRLRRFLRFHHTGYLVDFFHRVFRVATFDDTGLRRSQQNAQHVIVTGYHQDSRLFNEINTVVKREFRLVHHLTMEEKAWLRSDVSRPVVGIHVRRGDYSAVSTIRETYGICTVDYFCRGIAYIENVVGRCTLLVFSDSPEIVKHEFEIGREYRVVRLPGCDESRELILLSFCDHLIMSNSTYSWWAAWLRDQPGRHVVAPFPWYAQESSADDVLILPHWIRIPK